MHVELRIEHWPTVAPAPVTCASAEPSSASQGICECYEQLVTGGGDIITTLTEEGGVWDIDVKIHPANEAEICRQQRLFGSSRTPVLRMASRAESAAFARMLRSILRDVHGIRSGYGRSERTLERMTIRIADTLSTLAA